MQDARAALHPEFFTLLDFALRLFQAVLNPITETLSIQGDALCLASMPKPLCEICCCFC